MFQVCLGYCSVVNIGVTVFQVCSGYCSVFNLGVTLCFRFVRGTVQCLKLV